MGDCQESTCLGQLELKNVSYEDVGLYVCKNSVDTTQVGAIYVYVKGNINVELWIYAEISDGTLLK